MVNLAETEPQNALLQRVDARKRSFATIYAISREVDLLGRLRWIQPELLFGCEDLGTRVDSLLGGDHRAVAS
jgi:hypothetical protein